MCRLSMYQLTNKQQVIIEWIVRYVLLRKEKFCIAMVVFNIYNYG